MEISMAHLPGWVIVLDYILGLIMWTLIGRVAMNIFLPLHSNFFFHARFREIYGSDNKYIRPSYAEISS